MEKKYFKYKKEFTTECGDILPEIEICYHISKEYKYPDNNKKVIWITHALTANSDPTDWWAVLTGEGKLFDQRKYTIICANLLGSCYGSTCPASAKPGTNKPWLLEFPKITVRDIVRCHELLRNELGIKQIDLLVGSSVGGFQAIEWGIINPSVIKNITFIASNARVTPWSNAFNETQRMALFADETFVQQQYKSLPNGEGFEISGGKKGLAVARAISLISYRSYSGYNISQKEDDDETLFNHRAQSYQQYQGEKLVKRFDAYSYLAMLNLHDSHNIGRGRGGVDNALKKIEARVVCIGIDNDYLFPPQEQEYVASHVKNGEFHLITSQFGHDGFLLEWEQIKKIIELSGVIESV